MGSSIQDQTGAVAIEISDSIWIESMKERLERTIARRPRNIDKFPVIFKVPSHLRSQGAGAYEPKVVSTGPYHHGGNAFEDTEHLKWRYLHRFLESTPDPNRILGSYLMAMKRMEEQARRCYSELVEMDPYQFAEMLMLDGCFIVLLLRNGVQDDDRVDDWINQITYDLLLLENQIPFFVLEELHHLVHKDSNRHDGPADLVELAVNHFNNCIPMNAQIPEGRAYYDHLLHLFHSCILPSPEPPQPLQRSLSQRISSRLTTRLFGSGFHEAAERAPRLIPPATKLRSAGVKFRHSARRGPLEATFHDGMLEMSQLAVYDHTRPLFQNLIAFEQCHPQRIWLWVTRYACFMENLLSKEADVALLQREGVVLNCVGTEEEITGMFGKLCKNVVHNYEHSHLRKTCIDVDRYYSYRRPRWKAKIAKAAVILLILTVVQTLFTVLSYVLPR